MASRFALACRLRRVLAWLTQIIFLWLTQKPQKAQTLRVAAPSLPSGMYTLGETPTAVSDSDAAHSVKVCEVCVRQKNQRETKKSARRERQTRRMASTSEASVPLRILRSLRETKKISVRQKTV